MVGSGHCTNITNSLSIIFSPIQVMAVMLIVYSMLNKRVSWLKVASTTIVFDVFIWEWVMTE